MIQSPSRAILPITSLARSSSLLPIHSPILVVLATEQFEKVHLTNKKIKARAPFIFCCFFFLFFFLEKLENLDTCTGFTWTASKFHYNRKAER